MRAPFSPAEWARLALIIAPGMLVGCGESDVPDDELNPVRASEIARIVPASEAIAGAHIPTLDPATMVDAELRKALGAGARCEFRYTSDGKPVLAVNATSDGNAADGVVKLNGNLVMLKPASADGALVLSADRIGLTLTPDAGAQVRVTGNVPQQEANLVFEVDDSLRVGYRGYFRCLG